MVVKHLCPVYILSSTFPLIINVSTIYVVLLAIWILVHIWLQSVHLCRSIATSLCSHTCSNGRVYMLFGIIQNMLVVSLTASYLYMSTKRRWENSVIRRVICFLDVPMVKFCCCIINFLKNITLNSILNNFIVLSIITTIFWRG